MEDDRTEGDGEWLKGYFGLLGVGDWEHTGDKVATTMSRLAIWHELVLEDGCREC